MGVSELVVVWVGRFFVSREQDSEWMCVEIAAEIAAEEQEGQAHTDTQQPRIAQLSLP